MKLDELISHLINTQGLSEEEALEVASATLKARRGGGGGGGSGGGGAALQRRAPERSAEMRKFSASAQDYEPMVDYGEESAAEAEERWLQQEMNDPDGLFAGGATSGGVFGDGTIALSNCDPAARSRVMQNQNQVLQMRATAETLRLLNEINNSRRELPPAEDAPPKLGSAFGRFLGSKKRG